MKVRNSKTTKIDNVQLLISRGVTLHPDLHQATLAEYEHLDQKGRLCLLPETVLELYSNRIRNRVNALLACCLRSQTAV